jgi:hypothetical protein
MLAPATGPVPSVIVPEIRLPTGSWTSTFPTPDAASAGGTGATTTPVARISPTTTVRNRITVLARIDRPSCSVAPRRATTGGV